VKVFRGYSKSFSAQDYHGAEWKTGLGRKTAYCHACEMAIGSIYSNKKQFCSIKEITWSEF
jgi:hypothetical protein